MLLGSFGFRLLVVFDFEYFIGGVLGNGESRILLSDPGFSEHLHPHKVLLLLLLMGVLISMVLLLAWVFEDWSRLDAVLHDALLVLGRHLGDGVFFRLLQV
jgi:hypothetical protein